MTAAEIDLRPLDQGGAPPRAAARHAARRIGVFGLFGVGNFGNDGSLEAILRLIEDARPQAEVLCICGQPEKLAPHPDRAAVAINWRPANRLLRRLDRLLLYVPGEMAAIVHATRHLASLDVVVIPGTGILDDFGTGPLGMPYWLFRWCVLAKLLGTRVVFVNVGAGPIHSPISRWLMKTAARLATYRSYRDEQSKRFMTAIGGGSALDHVFPDIAFSLPAPSPENPTNANVRERLVVGVGVMSYNGWRGDTARNEDVYDDYLDKITGFIRWLLDSGYAIRILTGDDSDRVTAERLVRNLADERASELVVSEAATSLDDVMRQIGETDIVVATRYHNIVCALMMGKPTLSIGYATKNDVLLDAVGLSAYCQHIDSLDVSQLRRQFGDLAAHRDVYAGRVRDGVAEFRAHLARQWQDLLARVL